MSPGSFAPWIVVALAALVAHRVATSLARAAAWRAVSREDPARAHRLALLLRALHPWGASEDTLLTLASRALAGDPLDVDREVAALTGHTPSERAVFAVCLDAWRGDADAAAARLDDPEVLDAALAQGEGALALTVTAEARGAQAMCAVWRRRMATHPTTARGPGATGELLVLAAQLGQVEGAEALLDDLSAGMPAARRGYWRALALFRAGRVDEAREEVLRARSSPRAGRALRRRLDALLHAPPTPAADLAEAADIVAALRDRIDARVALAELGWHRSQGAWPATIVAVELLVMVHAGLWAAGVRDVTGWVRWGALTVPLSGLDASGRLLSYALLHADLVHLSVNTATLWTFGRFIERRLGAATLVITLALGAVCGGLVALWSSPPGTVVLGASAAVFALVGASVAHIAREPALRRTPEGRSELALLGTLLAAQGIYDHFATRVSGGAHVGGLLAGVALGALTSIRARGGGRPQRPRGE